MKKLLCYILMTVMLLNIMPCVAIATENAGEYMGVDYWPDVERYDITVEINTDASDSGIELSSNTYYKYEGHLGNGIDWVLMGNQLQIKGEGAMPSFENTTPPWMQHKDDIRNVIIQDGITNIGDFAFFNMPNLKEICVPDSVTSVGLATVSGMSDCKVHIKNNKLASDVYKASGLNVCEHKTGVCGDEVAWQIASDELHIYGEGYTYDYSPEKLPGWADSYDSIKNIYVNTKSNSKVSGLGSYLFYGESGALLQLKGDLDYIGAHALSYDYFDGITAVDSADIVNDYFGAYNYRKVPAYPSLPDVGMSDEQISELFEDAMDRIYNESGVLPNGVEWQYGKSSKTLIISGRGEVPSYDDGTLPPWAEFDINILKICNGISSVGKNAFSGKDIKSRIQLAASVTHVDDDAFGDASGNVKVYSYSTSKSDELFKSKGYTIAERYAVTVNYTQNGGTQEDEVYEAVAISGYCETMFKITLPYGDSVHAPSNAAFAGWEPESEDAILMYSGNEFYVNGDVTIYALYEFNPIKFRSADGEDGKMHISVHEPAKQGFVMPEIAPKAGWTTIGWTDSAEKYTAELNSGDVLTEYNKEFYYAVYSKNVKISFDTGSNQHVKPVTDVVYYNASGNVKKTAVVLPSVTGNVGMEFSGWKCDELDSRLYEAGDTVEIDGDYKFKAVWSESSMAEAPVISVANILGGKEISISSEAGKVYYTLDGSEPTDNSAVYQESFVISDVGKTTIKACVIKDGKKGNVAISDITVEQAPVPKVTHPSGEIYDEAWLTFYSDIPGYEVYYSYNDDEFVPFTMPEVIDFSVVVKAYLRVPGYADSEICTFEYKFVETVIAPVIDDSCDVIGGKKISVSSDTEGASIYYTTDGSVPDENSKIYSGEFTIVKEGVTLVRAIAMKDGMRKSTETVCKVSLSKAAPVTADTESGAFNKSITVTFNTQDKTDIYYTLDGTNPDTNSIKYTSPLALDGSATVKAIRVGKGYVTSKISTYTYIIDIPVIELPVIEVSEASDITKNSAKLSATVVSDGGEAVKSVVFTYYEGKEGVKYRVAGKSDNGSVYTATVSNLAPGTEYSYYAAASNSAGTANSNIKTFVTDDIIVPQNVNISESCITLRSKEKRTLVAKVLPTNAEDCTVVWSSSDDNVVKVSSDGVVTAVGVGSATVTARSRVNREAYGVCEVVVSNSIPGGIYDFSEWNMLTNTKSFAQDGIVGNTEDGGSFEHAMMYLARWDGPVLEENDPYHTSGWQEGFNYLEKHYKEIDADFHVQDIVVIPKLKTTAGETLDVEGINEYKAAIMKYGAVSNAYYHIYDSCLNFKKGIKYSKYFYYPYEWSSFNQWTPEKQVKTGGGHAIAIVGWDDYIPAEYFERKCNCRTSKCNEDGKYFKPAGDGAFICRNSWGDDFGDDGYFYISYYDKYLLRYLDGIAITSVEYKTNYNKIYQYDPYLCTGGAYFTQNSKVLERLYESNVFPEKGKTLEADEELKAVAFFTMNESVDYKIYVVKDFKNKETSFKNKIFLKEGSLENAGYHTVVLDEAVELSAGTRFAVVVELISHGEPVYLPLEKNVQSQKDGVLKEYITVNAGYDESFYTCSPGGDADWLDTLEKWGTANNANVCVKAFTDNGNASESAELYHAIDNENRAYPEYVEPFSVTDELGEITESSPVNKEVNGPGTMMSSIITVENSSLESEGYSLPSKYDLREQFTMPQIRNQLNWGSCWTFATYASLETSLMRKLATGSAGVNVTENNYDMYVENISRIVNSETFDVELATDRKVVAEGTRSRLDSTVYPYNASDKGVMWHSSDESVALVDTFGYVTALKTGTAIITATAISGDSMDACTIEVVEGKSVESVSIVPDKTEVEVGSVFMLDYKVSPLGCENSKVTWSTNKPKLLNVDEYGVFTALAAGIVNVFVTTEDGNKTDSINIVIKEPEVVQILDMAVETTEEAGKVNVESALNVKSPTEQDAYAICAVYTTDGKMMCVTTVPVHLGAGATTVNFEDMSFDAVPDTEYILKGFVMDGFESFAPLCEAYIYAQ